MTSALDNSVGIVGYLALFSGIGFVFIFMNLLLGRFLRPSNPNREKLEIYECGEPAIGSSFVQFDLRFYVVALVFIIFDVEVAFLFPWATVFGKVTNLRAEPAAVVQAADGGVTHLSPTARGVYRELGAGAEVDGVIQATDSQLRHGVREGGELKLAGYDQVVTFAFVEMGIFFSILLVAFAYVWRQGALDWIRAESAPPVKVDVDRVSSGRGPHESVLSA
ncbi:MAG: NADH-quinone oxidoreductase subunit A [Planctomycetales bacterium]|nr:NADH-quinone oxidoreductase subunit A [Planctomycetales bacterium]